MEKWFWLICILLTTGNAFYLKFSLQKKIADHPELKEGYEKIFRGSLIFMNIPWLVMGIGVLFGGSTGVGDYMRPRAGNPFVLAFHLSVIALWLLSIYWIYFRGGAEFLIRHPGIMNYDFKTPLALKLSYALMLLAGALGLTMMWISN